MAHQGLTLATAALLACGLACGGAAKVSPAMEVKPVSSTASSSGPPGTEPPPGTLDRYARFYSKRFDLSVPLPDGKAWRIDDHSRPELVATHEPTRATVVLSVSYEAALMNHQTCEDLARARKLVPQAMRTVSDQTGLELEEFDTRVWVTVEPPPSPGAPLVGHVLAFGGFLRKCVFFHYRSQVASADGEAELATRLALARTRIFEGLALDPFHVVTREAAPVEQAPR